jgi:CheY-like chemotaxis protein
VAFVVCVDDHPIFGQAIESIFTLEGHRVEWTTNGSEGIQLILSKHPDLAIVDMFLAPSPNATHAVNGLDVCRSVLATWPAANLAIVSGFLSASMFEMGITIDVPILSKSEPIESILCLLSA